jgi:hypothetical protein
MRQKLTESRRLRLKIVTLIWLFLAGSALLMSWAWFTHRYPLQVAAGFAFFAEFSLAATCFTLVRRFAENRTASTAFVLSSLFLWELVPAGLLSLAATIIWAPEIVISVPALITIVLANWARRLISEEKFLPGVLLFSVPVAVVVVFCFSRIWAKDSVIWPIVGSIHLALLLALLCMAATYIIGNSRRSRATALN